MLEREKVAKEALEQRVNDALAKLDSEKRVAEYLRETKREGAARRSEDRVADLERNILKYRSDLP